MYMFIKLNLSNIAMGEETLTYRLKNILMSFFYTLHKKF